MTNIKNLCDTIGGKAYDLGLHKPEIPQYILDNLKYSFFDWQKKAFERFLTYQAIKERENPNTPTHLMFNMATGTGKTLLMASTILYYYQQGYRHFLFFVNQNNIVDKTENNFINNTHTKYLFKEKIVIDDKTIAVKKVHSFSEYPQGIEIKFTSMQKLYNDIHVERENQTTLKDLHSKNIVMLADEAHHLNTETKKKDTQQEFYPTEITGRTKQDEIERRGWEDTVIKLILNKNGNKEGNKNVLLEFTATIPATESIAKKYEDKIIYQFGLKEFLQAGYTKEINLISSTLDKKERILQALLFAWYRHKIALKHGIANFKPVILFRSKTIEESKADYQEFLTWMDGLSSRDFDFIKNIGRKIYQAKHPTLYEMGKSRTETLLNFIKDENIHWGEIAEWMKQNYPEKNTIITNSKTNKNKKETTDEETEKLLNNLEDKNNHLRAIFTVDRLTEGWDVLNLFDIVRLYSGQNAGGSNKKTPEATTKEKQLIGRGVRYFPFAFKDKIKNKRKFDHDLDHELRVLEELYYYTYDEESKYISHLKQELKKDGYLRDDKVVKSFKLKDDFLKSKFYQETKVWYNKRVDNPNRKRKDLKDIKKNFSLSPYKIKGLEFVEEVNVLGKEEDTERLIDKERQKKNIIYFKKIEKHIVQKAINIKAKQENSLFRFENLKKELEITSMDELQNDKLADFKVEITAPAKINYDGIDNNDKLKLTMRFLDYVFTELKQKITPKIGSDFIAGDFKKFFANEKTKTINENNLDDTIPKDNDWYVLDSFVGTSEEKALIQFIKDSIDNDDLENKYEVYLLRNEEVYKIYDFKKGRGFQPDFILFLKTKNKKNAGVIKTELYYQVFIEPKGEQLLGSDNSAWKEKFLKKISKEYGFNNIIKAENPHYRLIGLPFFNAATKANRDFQAEYNRLLKDSSKK